MFIFPREVPVLWEHAVLSVWSEFWHDATHAPHTHSLEKGAGCPNVTHTQTHTHTKGYWVLDSLLILYALPCKPLFSLLSNLLDPSGVPADYLLEDLSSSCLSFISLPGLSSPPVSSENVWIVLSLSLLNLLARHVLEQEGNKAMSFILLAEPQLSVVTAAFGILYRSQSAASH